MDRRRKDTNIANSMNIEDIFPENYVVFDLETTGFSPTQNHIIQIGIVEVEERDASGGENSFLMNPNYPYSFRVPEQITELTGITSREVSEQGLDPAILIPTISDILCHTPNVTHNGIKFDRAFFNSACRQYDCMMPWNGYWLDTAVIYKATKLDAIPMMGIYETMVEFAKTISRPVRGLKYNLPHCCRDLGVDIADLTLHQAASDCIATHRLFEQLREDLLGW